MTGVFSGLSIYGCECMFSLTITFLMNGLVSIWTISIVFVNVTKL